MALAAAARKEADPVSDNDEAPDADADADAALEASRALQMHEVAALLQLHTQTGARLCRKNMTLCYPITLGISFLGLPAATLSLGSGSLNTSFMQTGHWSATKRVGSFEDLHSALGLTSPRLSAQL